MEGKHLAYESYQRIRAFINTMANVCKACTRRMPSNCSRCDLESVGRVLEELDRSNGSLPPGEQAERISSLMPRIRVVLRQLVEKGPCKSTEIDIGDYCIPKYRPQYKRRALRVLARNGLVVITQSPFGGYAYDVNRSRMDVIESIISHR